VRWTLLQIFFLLGPPAVPGESTGQSSPALHAPAPHPSPHLQPAAYGSRGHLQTHTRSSRRRSSACSSQNSHHTLHYRPEPEGKEKREFKHIIKRVFDSKCTRIKEPCRVCVSSPPIANPARTYSTPLVAHMPPRTAARRRRRRVLPCRRRSAPLHPRRQLGARHVPRRPPRATRRRAHVRGAALPSPISSASCGRAAAAGSDRTVGGRLGKWIGLRVGRARGPHLGLGGR
jgi:hypothetical protein